MNIDYILIACNNINGGSFLVHRIIQFEKQYRDDMIFCLLSAKDALGRIPRLNEDLLDIQKNYFDNGDMFWLAINEENRVVGMIGTKSVSSTDLWLKRLYIMPSLKRIGIGSSLLSTLEAYAIAKGIKTLHTRFSVDYKEAAHFYISKGFVEYEKSDDLKHFIKTINDFRI